MMMMLIRNKFKKLTKNIRNDDGTLDVKKHKRKRESL